MKRVHVDRVRGICEIPGLSYGGSYSYSDHWGGDAYYSSNEYSGAMAVATQMSINATCGSMSALGQWVGLGGYETGQGLIQTGTFAEGYGDPAYGYSSFWEYIPPGGSSSAVSLGVTPSPGDLVLEEVSLTSHSTAYVDVYDENTGADGYQYVSIGVQILSTAEFIDERPKIYGQYAPLLDYGWTYWRNMSVRDGSSSIWTGVYQEPTEYWVQMYNNGHYLSKTTGSYSDNHMRDHWYACS
jgi:hypothetical protein